MFQTSRWQPRAGRNWYQVGRRWEEGRKGLPSTKLREAGGKSPMAPSGQTAPYEEVVTFFIAPRFPSASWRQPGPAGEEGLADSWVSERKEPGVGLGLCSDILCDSPVPSGCHVFHPFKQPLGFEELQGLVWGDDVEKNVAHSTRPGTVPGSL